MIGTTLSHYRIEDELGRGGMGIVYKARDTKLDRDVAIKVLPSSALASAEDRERFYREAKSAAQLHHPNIASVFEIDEAVPSDAPHGTQPSPFIAMEYIAGGTLQDKIKEAPLSLSDGVKIASQVAEALKAAHGKDIVHRDIKSANVMITEDGVAKVLDFGLAKTNQSTMLTRMGSTLGTVAYMSPEQARGQEVDGRTDLYSLGTMLYEMVAGRLPYAGEYEQAVVYGILNEPPEPLTSLRTGVPMQLEWIVNKLLAKDADYRYQSAAGLLADLKALDLSGSGHSMRSMSTMSAASIPTEAPPSSSRRFPIWGYGALVLMAAVGMAVMWLLQPTPREPVVRKLNVQLDLVLIQDLAISPSGRYWAVSGVDSSQFGALTILDLRTGSYTTMGETEGFSHPRFSPDGRWLLAGRGTEVVTILVPDGRPVPVGIEGTSFDWISDRTIAVTRDNPILYTYDLDTQLTEEHNLSEFDSTIVRVDLPERIPGSNDMLLTADTRSSGSLLVQFNTSNQKAEVLSRNACCGRPVGRDALVYQIGTRAGQAVGQKVDFRSSSLTGSPVDLVGSQLFNRFWGAGLDGSFVYVPGATFDEDDIVTRYDSESKTRTRTALPIDQYDRASVSPDGKHIAVEVQISVTERKKHIAIFEVETGVGQRFTYANEESRAPTWSSNGKIYYSTGPSGDASIYSKNADGTGPEELLVEEGDYPHASRDGKWLAYATNTDLRAIHLETGEVTIVDSTFTKQGDPKISPDGRYIAFTADSQSSQFVSGAQRLFVRSFPDPNLFYERISEIYADDPEWAADGTGLFFRNRGRVYELPVDISGVFRKVSSATQIDEVPGINMRLTVDPSTGDIFFTHPPGNGGISVNSSQVTLIENLPAYIDQLTNIQ